MDITYGFLIYAALYRIVVILSGTACIFLGYHLIIKDPVGQGKTTAMFENGGLKVTLINFWPGIYFALFGTILILLMLWQGNPHLVMKQLADTQSTPDTSRSFDMKQAMIRGADTDNNYYKHWSELSKPNLKLADATKHIRAIANKWKNENRNEEALSYARLVANVEPGHADNWTFLSELFQANGDHDNAAEAMKKAASLNPVFKSELQDLEKFKNK